MEKLIEIKKLTNMGKYSIGIVLPKDETLTQFGNIDKVQIYFTEDSIILKPVRDIGIELTQVTPQEINVPQAV
jgi:hypothetical protein